MAPPNVQDSASKKPPSMNYRNNFLSENWQQLSRHMMDEITSKKMFDNVVSFEVDWFRSFEQWHRAQSQRPEVAKKSGGD